MNPPEPRRVLIATYSMTPYSGSDLYTRDLALALLRRGWQPVVYTTVPGALAEELRQATIPVTNDISAIAAAPHVIHGHHHLEALTALARFPGVPALFVCHDGLTWHSTPPRTPRIGQYIAVDRNCRDRMMLEHGIPESVVRILPNAVDLERFQRRPPLPRRPLRALVFSNAASTDSFASTIEAACSQRGITLDVVGRAAGTATEHPEEILSRYDLVFGKARCALEAAAAGNAVIVCDAGGLAGMITTGDLDDGRVEVFVDLVNELAGNLIDADIQCVAGDAMEGFNPAHDLCRALIDSAAAIVRMRTGRVLQNYEFAVHGDPVASSEEALVRLELDESALDRKIDAAMAYRAVRGEVEDALDRFGRRAFAVECLRSSSASAMLEQFELTPPAYESIGESRVSEGRYREVVRYREHVLPVISALGIAIPDSALSHHR